MAYMEQGVLLFICFSEAIIRKVVKNLSHKATAEEMTIK